MSAMQKANEHRDVKAAQKINAANMRRRRAATKRYRAHKAKVATQAADKRKQIQALPEGLTNAQRSDEIDLIFGDVA